MITFRPPARTGYSAAVSSTPRFAENLPLVARVAREVMAVGVDGKLPITTDLQQRYGVGSGTIQRALAEVRDRGGVGMRSRGQRGTFVTEVDLPRLWQLAQLGSLDLLLPATESTEMRALITGMAKAVNEAVGVDLTVSVLAGAAARIDGLADGLADGAVMSSGALEKVVGLGVDGDPAVTVQNGWCVTSLGHGSYYRDGSILVVARDERRSEWRRVGVDSGSSDHKQLSEAEFQTLDTEVVDTPFARIPALVRDQTIDAGIWHRVDLMFPPESVGLTLLPLEAPEHQDLLSAMSSAVIVTPEGSPLHRVLERIDVQKLVVSENAVPPSAPVALRILTHH